MPNVKITFLSFIANIAGKKTTEIDVPSETTIEQLLAILTSRFGQDFEERVYNTIDGLNRFVMIMINGADMRTLNGLNTILETDDEIMMLPAIAGG